MGGILEQLNRRHNVKEMASVSADERIVNSEEGNDFLTQFLQMQKTQVLDVQENFEQYCNVLTVFRFTSSKFDIILFKSCLLPILLGERDIEPTVSKIANQFVVFNFEDIQELDIMELASGATNLHSFLKAYKSKRTKIMFLYERFDYSEKLNINELLSYQFLFSILCNSNPLEKDYVEFENRINSGLSAEEALFKRRVKNIPTSGAENCFYIISISENELVRTFWDFEKW